jgi:hypothetical protein
VLNEQNLLHGSAQRGAICPPIFHPPHPSKAQVVSDGGGKSIPSVFGFHDCPGLLRHAPQICLIRMLKALENRDAPGNAAQENIPPKKPIRAHLLYRHFLLDNQIFIRGAGLAQGALHRLTQMSLAIQRHRDDASPHARLGSQAGRFSYPRLLAF